MDPNRPSGRRPQHHSDSRPSGFVPPSSNFDPRRGPSPGADLSDPFADMRGHFERDFFEPHHNQQFFRRPFMDGFGSPFAMGQRGFQDQDESDFANFGPRQHPEMRSQSPRPPPASEPKTSRVESIPIRVIHEKVPINTEPSTKPKHPAASRNTTELPAKRTVPDHPERSPRIARASSEPPKTFQKHFAQMKQPTNHYSAIPEGGVMPSGGGSPQPDGNLQVPESALNNLATSASAPSVPTSSQSPKGAEVSAQGAPMAGPPRVPERKESAPPNLAASGVRHIPIFVEGRDDPVVNRPTHAANAGQRPAHHSASGGFAKPADFYPSGAQKANRGDVHPQRMHMNLPSHQEQQTRSAAGNKTNEPTSPVSPPPGPIPMGWVPPDPISPLPAPEAPIPLPYSSKFAPGSHGNPVPANSASKPESPKEVERKPTMIPPAPKMPTAETGAQVPVNVQSQQPVNSATDASEPAPPAQADPALSKMEKIKAEVAILVKKIDEFKGNKKDKEYLFLDEMLTRHLIALDEIDTGGRDELRQMRKESIKSITRCLSMLDSRAKSEAMEKEAATNNQILSDLAAMSAAQAKK